MKPFVEQLHKLNLYEDFEFACGDVYHQLFVEWLDKNELDMDEFIAKS